MSLCDGFKTWNWFGRPASSAVLDFDEERLLDVFGDPGKLIAAKLGKVVWLSQGRPEHVGYHKRRLLLGGHPQQVWYKHRRYLRWKWIEPDPPPHDDPEWIHPP